VCRVGKSWRTIVRDSLSEEEVEIAKRLLEMVESETGVKCRIVKRGS